MDVVASVEDSGFYAARGASTFFSVGRSTGTQGKLTRMFNVQFAAASGWRLGAAASAAGSGDTINAASTTVTVWKEFDVPVGYAYTADDFDVVTVSIMGGAGAVSNGIDNYMVTARPVLAFSKVRITIIVGPSKDGNVAHSATGLPATDLAWFNVVVHQFGLDT